MHVGAVSCVEPQVHVDVRGRVAERWIRHHRGMLVQVNYSEPEFSHLPEHEIHHGLAPDFLRLLPVEYVMSLFQYDYAMQLLSFSVVEQPVAYPLERYLYEECFVICRQGVHL